MNYYVEFFEKIDEISKELDLGVEINFKKGTNPKIWVYSCQYLTGKFVDLEEFGDIGNIDFKEMSVNACLRDSIEKIKALGYEKKEIAKLFSDAID